MILRSVWGKLFALTVALIVVATCPVIAQSPSDLPTPDALESEAEGLSRQWNQAALRRAADIYLQASNAWELQGDHGRAADSLREAAEANLILGDPIKAEGHLHSALQIASKGGDQAAKVRVLGLLSQLTLKNSKTVEAESYMREASTLASFIAEPCAKAAASTAAADLSYAAYKLRDSIEQATEALPNWQTCGDVGKEIETLSMLGYSYAGIDETRTALNYVDRALTRSIDVGEVRLEAVSRFQMGFIFLLLNEPQKALETCRRAESLFPADMDLIEKARLSNGIAAIYNVYGDWESSLIYTKRALELFREENYSKGELAASNALINLSFLNNDPDSAFNYLSKVKELSNLLDDDFYIATSYEYVGNHYFADKDDANAKIFFGQALTLMRRSGFKKGLSSVLSKLGSIAARRGKYSDATKYFDESLELSRQIGDGFGESGTLAEIAKLESAKGSGDNPLDLIEQSISLTESLSSKVFDAQLKREYFASYFDRYESYVSILMKQEAASPGNGYSERALAAAERSKARVLLENILISEAESVNGANPEAVQREKEIRREINSKSDRLAEMLAEKGNAADTQQISGEITELRNQVGEITASLKNSSPIYSSLRDPEPFDPGKFQREVLDDNSVFLEFSLGSEQSYLWVIGKSEITHYFLPPRDQIELKVTKMVGLVRSRERRRDESIESYTRRVEAADRDYSVISQELSREILGSAAETIRGKRLIIAPDGRLNYLPFGALPFPNSTSGEPLIATNEVAYAPSASMLSLLRSTGTKERPVRAKDLMVFADPVFTASDERLTGREPDQSIFETSLALLRSGDSIKDLGRLPASQTEAVSVTKIFGNSTIASGFSANRERVLNGDLANYRVIHFATHGILNEKHPELSGILLSLFDDNGKASEGFIREQDIYGLGLNADLVVLSACSSGVGKEVRGEGTLSLNSAFLQAGARSVVSSLWKVDDNATEQLMRHFYHALANGGLTPAQALRFAQLELSKDARYSSPFYWAAFTIQGDSGSKLAFSSRNWNYIVVGAGLVLIAVFLVLWVRRSYRRRVTRR